MRTLKIITWNVGAGALGADADVAYDGGRHFIPSPTAAVEKNVLGIRNTLASLRADAFLLQELSSGSILNRWHNVRHAVHKALSDYHSMSVSNFSLPLFFDFLRNEHGMGTYISRTFRARKKFARPFKTGEYFYRIIPRRDYALTTFIKRGKGKPLALINTHLSSFDKHAAVRMPQFVELMKYAKRLNRRGHPVVIGADWNMHDGDISYHGDDEAHYQEYAQHFPHDLLPTRWRAHFPRNAPTLRTTNRPYVRGASTTAVIDGFVCSPEVRVVHIATIDLDFQHSDHNPVEMTITY